MDLTGLLYVIGFAVATTIFVAAPILFAWLISHRRSRPQKGLPYECGIDTIGDT
jgi:NADH:ubiquinone oxidoreductase subunit 3 (subunit A)